MKGAGGRGETFTYALAAPYWSIMLEMFLDPLYQLVISLLVALAVYFPMLTKLARQWLEDENYSHGFLIPCISLFLIYEKRRNLKDLAINPANSGLFITGFGLICYMLGTIGADLSIQRFSFLITIVGIVISTLGYRIFYETSFPIFYLVFMIPLPYVIFYAIASPLKLFVGKVAVEILSNAGLPIKSVGNQIFMPNAKLTIAYACSGLRSLISLTALGAVFGYYTQTKLWKRLIIFAATVPIAIISNIVRLLIVCLVAFVYGEEIATGFLHDFSGMVVFGVAVFLLIFIGGLLWEKPNKPASMS